MWIRVGDISHLKDVINQLRRNVRVTGTKTLMVLETWRQPPRSVELHRAGV